jgi:non-ribosomal peptide synthetase component F
MRVPQELKWTVPRPWTDTERPLTTLPQRFEAQVSKTPDATAVVFEGQSLSYAELNARANQLAHFLRRNGAVPDTLVGVCTERSLDLLVAIVGILKAGAGYLPLDPANPAERIAFIVGEAKPLLVLTQRQLFSRLPRNSARTICVACCLLTRLRPPSSAPLGILHGQLSIACLSCGGNTTASHYRRLT